MPKQDFFITLSGGSSTIRRIQAIEVLRVLGKSQGVVFDLFTAHFVQFMNASIVDISLLAELKSPITILVYH